MNCNDCWLCHWIMGNRCECRVSKQTMMLWEFHADCPRDADRLAALEQQAEGKTLVSRELAVKLVWLCCLPSVEIQGECAKRKTCSAADECRALREKLEAAHSRSVRRERNEQDG